MRIIELNAVTGLATLANKIAINMISYWARCARQLLFSACRFFFAMSLPWSLLLMMSITGTLLLDFTGGQQVGYHLSFMRVQVDMEVNRVLLECIFAFNNSIAVNANFYRNDELYNNLPQRRNFSQGVVFIVDRQSEGDFTCGESSGLVSDPPQTIVGE